MVQQLNLWTAGEQPIPFYQPKDASQISFAHFHEDNESVIIGLSHPAKLSLWEQFKSLFSKKWDSQIIRWNPDDKTRVVFPGPTGPLLDATIDKQGRFAVAIQAEAARIIPKPKEDIAKSEYNSEPIEAFSIGKGKNRQTAKVFLSPDRKYIVRQSPHNRKVQLFDQKGL